MCLTVKLSDLLASAADDRCAIVDDVDLLEYVPYPSSRGMFNQDFDDLVDALEEIGRGKP